MISCFNVSQLRPLALYMQGSPLGYRSVSMLAKGETEGLIYVIRSSLKGELKLSLLRVMVANHHGKKDTRLGWRVNEIEKAGPMGIWDAVGQQLEKRVERIERYIMNHSRTAIC